MTSSREAKGTRAGLILSSVLWGIMMLLATHFLFGMTWWTGVVLWTIGAIIFGIAGWKWSERHSG